MGSFPWEEHGPWMRSMLSQMGSFPLEDPERVPSLWSPSMRSDLEAVDPKPASRNMSFKNDKRGSMAM